MNRTAASFLGSRCDWPGMPDSLPPLCHWRCAICSFVLGGSLRQPWLLADPASGQYRGATIAETQAALACTCPGNDR